MAKVAQRHGVTHRGAADHDRRTVKPNVGSLIVAVGAGRQDLHLTGMPEPRPLAVYDNIKLYGKQYFGPDSNYLVRGQLRIKDQASLTVAPGVVIFEENATLGTIVVERGGQLWAVGNARTLVSRLFGNSSSFVHRHQSAFLASVIAQDRIPERIVTQPRWQARHEKNSSTGMQHHGIRRLLNV